MYVHIVHASYHGVWGVWVMCIVHQTPHFDKRERRVVKLSLLQPRCVTLLMSLACKCVNTDLSWHPLCYNINHDKTAYNGDDNDDDVDE